MALGNDERYYSPQYARFIQQDSFAGSTATPQSLNRFAYTHNNPNKYVDPSGNLPTVAVGALLGGLFGGLIEAAHQAVDVYNGDRKGFDLWSIGKAVVVGAAVGAVIGTGVGALALLGYGAAATVGLTAGGVVVGATSFVINAQDGRYAHGTIDLVASLLPFANKGVRGSFGQFARGGYTGSGVGTFKQNIATFRANGGVSSLKGLFKSTPEEALVILEEKPPEQKLLTDGGTQERISSGRLLSERSSVGNGAAIELTKGKFTFPESTEMSLKV